MAKQRRYIVTYNGGVSYNSGDFRFENGVAQNLSEAEAKRFINQAGFNHSIVESEAPGEGSPRTTLPAKAAPKPAPVMTPEQVAETDVAPNEPAPEVEEALAPAPAEESAPAKAAAPAKKPAAKPGPKPKAAPAKKAE